MFQLLLFLLIIVVVYFVSANYPPSAITEGFLSSEIIGTPLNEADTLIFTPGFQGSDRRQQPIADSPEKYGSLWTPSSELRHFRYPPFTPGKIHSVEFADNTSQIAGPIHPPPCPPVGTGPGFKGPDLGDYEKVLTGHENGDRPAEVAHATQNLCVCEDS